MYGQRVTLFDVLALLGIAGILLIFVISATARSGESAWRSRCGANLRDIGLRLQLYADDDGRLGRYPRTRYEPGKPPTAFTSPLAADPFGAGGPEANDVTAAIWLLMRTQDLPAEKVVCPGVTPRPTRYVTVDGRSNFESPDDLSYALANPYPDAAAVAAGYRWDKSVDPEFVVAADAGPTTAIVPGISAKSTYQAARFANSPNHIGSGQNALFGDGHVEFLSTPYAGARGDPIYATSRDGPAGTRVAVAESGSPLDALDTVCLPHWPESRWYPLEDPRSPLPTADTTTAVLTLLVAGYFFVRFLFYDRVRETTPPASNDENRP